MNLKAFMAAAALAATLGIGSAAAADASVAVTLRIVNNNSSSTIYHAKNPPSTQSDQFTGVLGWTVTPPDSLAAGASDASAKITLGANQQVVFTFGAPNSANPFSNGCTFTLKANSAGTALMFPVASQIGNAQCGISQPSGQAYNVQATLANF
jgi:hypothetical protein